MSKTYKSIRHVVTRAVCVGVECDICNKNIEPEDYFYEIITSHSDWGYDSGDSVEDHDVCSNKCLFRFLSDYYKDGVEDRNTKCIEIEHQNGWHKTEDAQS